MDRREVEEQFIEAVAAWEASKAAYERERKYALRGTFLKYSRAESRDRAIMDQLEEVLYEMDREAEPVIKRKPREFDSQEAREERDAIADFHQDQEEAFERRCGRE